MPNIFDITVSTAANVKTSVMRQSKLFRRDFTTNPAIFEGDINSKDGPCFAPCLFADDKRGLDQVDQAVLIVLDIDEATPEELKAAVKRMSAQRYEMFVYTTLRHTKDEPRVRVILQPDRVMTAHEYRHFIRGFTQHFDIGVDKCTEVASQLMFKPMVVPGKEKAFKWWEYGEPGVTVPVDDYILELPPEPVADDEHLPTLSVPPGVSDAAWVSCILKAYNAEYCDYAKWLSVGGALHDHYGGEPQGLELWISWSKIGKDGPNPSHGVKFDDQAMATKYRSFDLNRADNVTLTSVMNWKRQVGTDYVRVAAYREAIKLTADAADLAKLVESVSHEERLNHEERKSIARLYAKTHRRITKEEMDLGHAMQVVNRTSIDHGISQYFYNNYGWLIPEQKFIHLRSKARRTRDDMVMLYKAKMPLGNNGRPKDPYQVISEGSDNIRRVRVIESTMYKPGTKAPEIESTTEGFVVNTFRQDTWPVSSGPFDPGDTLDKEISMMVHKHLNLLASGDKQVVQALLQHIGQQRQRPTERIMWAYSLSSQLQGVGKSTLMDVYRTVLGEDQVGLLAPGDIAERWNSYATAPHIMSFIEEWDFDSGRVKAHAIKKMKQHITGGVISERKSYSDPKKGMATTAYAMLSNEADPLSLEAGGRRWLPVTVEAYTLNAVAAALECDVAEFFIRYYELMESYPDRFVAFVESIDLTGFNRMQAPVTREKLSVMSATPYSIVKGVLDEMIRERRDVDVTDNYVLLPRAMELVMQEAEDSDDTEVRAIHGHSRKRVEERILQALRAMDYRPLDRLPTERDTREKVRIGFQTNGRPRTHHVFYRKLPTMATQERVCRIITKRVKADRERRINEPAVVNIDGTAYDL